MNAQRFNVRENDYYGGDLYVSWDGTYEDGMFAVSPIEFVWRTWGGYGGVSLSLTRNEARDLAAALLAALDAATPTEVHRFSSVDARGGKD